MLPPRVFRQSKSVQSLALECGLSLACTDCAPCGCYRDRVKAPGLLPRTFPWLPQRPFGSKAPRTGFFSVSATDRRFLTRCTSRLMKLPCRLQLSLLFGTAKGFPPNASLWLVELSRSPHRQAHLGIQPDLPLLPGSPFIKLDGHRIIVPDPLLSTRLAVPSNLLEPSTYCAL
jgi:hypothetical protein